MATNLAKIVADFNTIITTKNAVGDTVSSIASVTDDDGVALDNGVYYFTVDGDNAEKEFIQATITGTALASIKTLSRHGTLTSGFARVHRVGALVEITDFGYIKMIMDILDGTTDLNASVPLKYDGTATISHANMLATKAYADALAIAGAPDATTSTKGIGRVSVAPASASIPIFVGDNDPRVPTQNENDAMSGNSGTAVSSSNKLVDAADAATTSTASKIVRALVSGLLDISWFARWLLPSGTAGETIAAGDPLYSRSVTQTTIASTESTYLDQANPGSAQGSGTSIEVGKGSSTDLKRGLVKFDVSSLPTTAADILKATLRLYISNRGYHSGIANDIHVSVQTSTWAEATATYTNFNGSFVTSAPVGRVADPGSTGQFIDLDVTQAVKNWVSGGASNYGFGIFAGNENTGSTNLYDSDDGSNPPQLVVTHRDTSADAAKLYKAKANNAWTAFNFVGLALEAASAGATVRFVPAGKVSTDVSGLTTGKPVFLTDAGGVSHTPGTIRFQLGYALSATSMLIQPGKKSYTFTLDSAAASGLLGAQYGVGGTGLAGTPVEYIGIPLGFRPRTIEVFSDGLRRTGATATGAQQCSGIAIDNAGTVVSQCLSIGWQSTTVYVGKSNGYVGAACTTTVGTMVDVISVPATGGFVDLGALLKIEFTAGSADSIGKIIVKVSE